MDFIDELRQLSSRVQQLRDQITTEEATKTAFVLPFLQLLGYDVFNPLELAPEYTADVGIKKGEKVDYAILKDGQPAILVECKWCGEPLEPHASQLFRYFATTTAKFGILTNGVVYRFFTDLDQPNKMDLTHFLELNLLDIKEALVPEVKKFHKANFDPDSLADLASELKYTTAVKQLLAKQVAAPDDDFVSYVLSEVYPGRRMQATIEKFREIVRKSFVQFINETVNEKLKSAMQPTVEQKKEDDTAVESATTEESRIQTTAAEMEAYYIVKSLLYPDVAPDRLVFKDLESYCTILLDNNVRKWICRLKLEGVKKSILFPANAGGVEVTVPLQSASDLYGLREQFVQAAKKHLK